MKHISEILAEQRQQRTPDMEIALQDLLELPEHEQKEIIFIGLLQSVSQLAWIMEKLK
jgi:hypothetical protein